MHEQEKSKCTFSVVLSGPVALHVKLKRFLSQKMEKEYAWEKVHPDVLYSSGREDE